MWKSVPNFPTYEADETGYIRNVKTEKVLHNSVSKIASTPVVSLVKDGKIYALEVRFIIACTFLDIDILARPKPRIEHKDKNSLNCALDNLIVRTEDPLSLDGEVWKPIEDFETTYAISNLGRVKRFAYTEEYIRKDTQKQTIRQHHARILKPTIGNQYYEINLCHKEKSDFRAIHRMVAQAFIPNPDNLPQVNHKDGDKFNNCVDNLEWCTARENVRHSIETGLRGSQKGIDRSAKQIKCIETGVVYKNMKETAEAIGGSYNTLSSAINEGRAYKGRHYVRVDAIDRRVKCLDTGQIFSGVAAAQEAFGVGSIADSICRRTCMDGWTFVYVRDNVNEEEYLKEARATYSKWPRANKRWEKENN